MTSRSALQLAFSLILAVLLLVNPSMGAERRIIINQSADYFGHDYRTLKKVPIKSCIKTCLADEQCKAFTYNNKARWCFLKTKVGDLKSFKGATAGRVVGEKKQVVAEISKPEKLKFLTTSQYSGAIRFEEIVIKRHGKKAVSDDEALAKARDAEMSGRLRSASFYYEQSVGINPKSFSNWLGLARTALNAKAETKKQKRGFPIVGVHSSINAYNLSTTISGRAEALIFLARALTRRARFRGALESYKKSLGLIDSVVVRQAFDKLRSERGFRILKHSVDADSAAPRICVQFSENLVTTADYTNFIRVDDKAPNGLDVEQRQLCVNGVTHGGRYRITLRSGLPSVYADEVLEKSSTLNVFIRDRKPLLRFTGGNYVLPRIGTNGIPIYSVNSSQAKLEVYRIGERALNRSIAKRKFGFTQDKYSLEQLESYLGQKVWTGTIDISPQLNKEVVTSIPVAKILPNRKPGAYVVVASFVDDNKNEWENKATQWFVISDIGLSTQKGNDGLHIFARSLSTAEPMAGVDIQLLSHSNAVLGTGKTDAKGYLKIAAGLVRGTASMAPGLVLAKRGDEDFVLVDLRKSAIDLSDRGVTGRSSPGPLDVFVYTERGIYRPGDKMHITALLRDDKAMGVSGVPLTIKLERPDGKTEASEVVKGTGAGGHSLSYQLQTNAMLGTWYIKVFADPKGDALSSKRILVEDFVPDRIEFDLTTKDKIYSRKTGASLSVEGRYLYGAPAAGMNLDASVRFTGATSLDGYKGFVFGLDDQRPSPQKESLGNVDVTDDKGKVTIKLDPELLPEKPGLFNARITVSMSESGGRAVERSISLPVGAKDDVIGIKALFEDGAVEEGGSAGFEVIAVGKDGAKISLSGLKWKLVKLNRRYQWYNSDYGWRYQPVMSTKKIAAGEIDVASDGVAKISSPVKWGRYRLEVTAGEDGPTSSVSFSAGWYVEATSTETPDGLEIALDKEVYKAGDVAKLNISPRFAGKALVTIGAETLLWSKDVDVSKTGGVVEIPVSKDWGAGAYVNVSLYRPGNVEAKRMPGRAIGIKWLKIDPQERNLSVKLDLPKQTTPRKNFEVPVIIEGLAAGQEAFVTVAAVDVGILNLTRYKPPQPGKYYFGQRQLGLELHDIYGKLIDGYKGVVGQVRSGGDAPDDGLSAKGAPPTQRLISFYSGVVKVDDSGKATINFDMPQFNGTVRVMAVAWTKAGVGDASVDVIVRDPIVLTATVPRFLTPGDKTYLRVDIANTDGPAGDYQLSIDTYGKLTADLPVSGMTIPLGVGERKSVVVPVRGVAIGKGVLGIRLSSVSGVSVEQALDVPVRGAQQPISRRHIVKLAANGGQLTFDRDFLAGFLPSSATMSLGVSRAAGLDVPSLLLSLDRYPYGCAEQTTSRALPLLYMSEVASRAGLGDDPAIRKRVKGAIARVLGYQAAAGSFGMWSPGSDNLWLDAYVTDFLTRAREKGYVVPKQAMTAALDNLQNSLSYDVNIASKGNEIAYAMYVLARNKRASIGDLRYYVNSKLSEFQSPLAKAQLAASLGLYGETEISARAFKAAFAAVKSPISGLERDDYGTSLRDKAAILALASEARPSMSFVSQMVAMVSSDRLGKRYTSTQEKAWLLLAARALYADTNKISLEVDGVPHTGNLVRKVSSAEIGNGITVANNSNENLEAAITITGIPSEPLPAGGDGFSIIREYYNLAGERIDPSVVAQNERFVVVLKVEEKNNWRSRIVVNDLLPAGFEIDNPRLVSSADLGNFKWLKRTSAAHTEFRKDRFVAAFNRTQRSSRELTMAYVVRAVSPGNYVHPAAVVEDMYRPHLSARTGQGSVEVVGPKP